MYEINGRLRLVQQTTLDLLWAFRWLVLYRTGRATWRDAKSFRHRKRTGTDVEHRRDRVVDDLRAVKVWPTFSRALLNAALQEHPLSFCFQSFEMEAPLATFVVPYMDGEVERRRGLDLCLQSIAGEFQGKARVLVVEQGQQTTLRWLQRKFPEGFVNIVLLERPYGAFERAATLNLGVRKAKTDLVILHDGDIMVVRGWCAFVQDLAASDYEVAWPALMTFYLDEEQTSLLPGRSPGQALSCCRELESISLIMRKDAYLHIGGMDERFVGWGGEDNEFYERAMTLPFFPKRPLFAVHAWHPLVDKNSPLSQANRDRLLKLRAQPVAIRINRLKESQFRRAHQCVSLRKPPECNA